MNTEITAYAAGTYGYFEYENYGDHIEITRYTGDEAEVTIPSEIDGLPVTALSEYSVSHYNAGTTTTYYFGVFAKDNGIGNLGDNTTLISVNIPDTITKMGKRTFVGCTSLSSVEISENVTEIGEEAFYNCDSLTSVTIPDSVEILGKEALAACDNLTIVKLGAKSIGDFAFNYDTKLTSVTVTDNVESIGTCAFIFCTKLEKIVLPDSITSIGRGVFYNCSSLSDVTLPNEITSLSSYNNDGFFGNCTSLKNIIIPYYVTSVDSNTFYNVPLESITIGARLSTHSFISTRNYENGSMIYANNTTTYVLVQRTANITVSQ